MGWLCRRCRTVGLWVAFVTFTLSASYHLIQQFSPDRREEVARVSAFAASELIWLLTEALPGPAPVTRVSLARIGGQPYYRLVSQGAAGKPAVQYRSTRDGQPLPAGEMRYAAELGQEFMRALHGHPAPASATGAAADGTLPDCCAPPTPEAETAATIGAPAAAGG